MQEARARQIVIYRDTSGKEPFTDWLSDLHDEIGRKAIIKRLSRVEIGLLGDCESVGDGVLELRFFLGPGYRIYFAEVTDSVLLLLCGGDKATQTKDIKIAQQYWREYQLHANQKI